jgi:KRAB domain-containing zinc finger protein
MCSICSREFSGLNSLKKHIPIHTRRIQHRCDVCGHVFGKKEYLLDHMRKHTGEVSPVCEVCGQTFNKSLKLKEHFKVHRNTNSASSGVNPYQCHVCRAVFNRAAVLGNHLATAHAETVYKCDICEATFGDVRGKNHHMYNEHQLDAFHQKCVWCPVCNQGFTRHYNLKVHMYKSHGKEYIENNFSAAELAALTKPPPGGSSSGTAKSRVCESPAKTASPTSVLKSGPAVGKSYFDAKNGTAMFSCQMCSEKFIRKSDLYIHLDTDHGVLLIGCTSCEDKFLDMLELQGPML